MLLKLNNQNIYILLSCQLITICSHYRSRTASADHNVKIYSPCAYFRLGFFFIVTNYTSTVVNGVNTSGYVLQSQVVNT